MKNHAENIKNMKAQAYWTRHLACLERGDEASAKGWLEKIDALYGQNYNNL